MRKSFTVMQRLKSLTGQHVNLDTASSDKSIRVNSRTYTIAASIVAMQVKPRAGVAMTDEVIGIESMPGINSTFTGKGIVCFKAEPYLGSTHGAISNDVRGFEVTLGGPSGGGTITGTVSGMKFINNSAKAPTGGIFMLHALTHGDTQPWGGLALLPDDDQLANVDESGTSGTRAGWVKVAIGTSASKTTRWIRLYDAAG